MRNENHNSFICPKCGSLLFPYEILFLHMGDIVGCEDCYSEDDHSTEEENWPEETMSVREYLNQGYVSHVDHQIDDIKESK